MNVMKPHHTFKPFLASTLLSSLVLQAGISHADDTEIFFGGPTIDQGIRPNVLFILDDSGSMSGTRMTQLKSAFSTIINNAGNINVGIMALNTKNGGSRLLSPVKNINETVNAKLATPAIMEGGDDATYIDNGTTNISDPTLVMGYTANSANSVTRSLGSSSSYSADYASYYVVRKDSKDYACSAKIADAGYACPAGVKLSINARSGSSGNDGILLFRNLNIPAGVSIQSAKLILTPTSTTATLRNFSIKIENTKTAEAFNNDSTIDAGRSFGNSDLNTSATPVRSADSKEIVFDLTSKFAKLQDLSPATNPIADVALRLRGTTDNSYSWYLGDGAENSPRLEITWTGSENRTRTTGLRFQNVAIPKGAKVTSARIDFVPAASDDRPVTFAVTAQNIADAPAFTANASNFTGRIKTASSVTWTPEEWRTASPQVYVEGPTVTSLVQSVIDNNSDWCGNNSMAFFLSPTSGSGSRTAFSLDAAKSLQPVLNVTYTGGEDGCLNPVLDISVVTSKDDGYQTTGTDKKGKTTYPVDLTSSTAPLSATHIASRYRKLPIKQGATVLDAQVIVTPDDTNTGTATLSFEKTGNSSELSTNAKNLSDRSLTSGTSCTITPVAAGEPVKLNCPENGIKNELQSIFSRSDWSDGNSLTLMLKPSSSDLELRTYESSFESAIKLRIKIASGGLGESSYTIREYTNGIVQSLNASGSTPIVPTLYEAAGYLTQQPGKHIGSDRSPITSSCQASYLVLLTDGAANGYTTASRTGIASLTGTTCTGDATDDDEKCGRSAVKWLAQEDQATFDGLNTVTTHTIGFNTSSDATATKFLNDLAQLGGGKAYQAENAGELANAFNEIVQAALATNTTYVNASAPVSSFNRADNLDELYFALFRPSESDRWLGNLKRYRMKIDNGVATIVDADDAPAIDLNSGFFKTSARSFWSATQDGDDIARGGAASMLPAPASRQLFTYLGASPAGKATDLEKLLTTNTNITGTKLGNSSMSSTERTNLLNYIRGLDIDEDGNSVARQALGDPIHSSPRLITYACKDYNTDGTCAKADMSAIIGSNEGFLHLFDAATGVEQSAFMPEALLPNIKQLQANAKSTSQKPRLYGMDNTVTLWVNDANNNGVIYGGKDPDGKPITGKNSGEFVYAYATMGRGGRNIYALDISDPKTPKMLWQILGGSTGFEKLGQTWSAPVKTRIKVGSEIKDVLIFGGGYDTKQDTLNQADSIRSADGVGNALYIVDAKTGAKIWSAGNDDTHDLTLPQMKYGIPSKVRVIDIQAKSDVQVDKSTGQLKDGGALIIDTEKTADQIFVGDMGGQVWRFFINHGKSGKDLVTPGGSKGDGIFASVGGNTPASARRFYHEPDVSLLKVGYQPVLTVNIGSGYRGHPLNKTIEDRFYSFRTDTLFRSDDEGTLGEDDMYDATNNLIQSGSTADKTAAKTAFGKRRGGWYITLKGAGEKVLSRALTAGDAIYFNTYEPSSSKAACSASVGQNRSYAVRLLNATPARLATDAAGTYEDRYQESNSGGISSDPQLFCQGNDCYVLPDPSVAPTQVRTPPLGKTYWIDETTD